jgi:hypothetical protein
MKTPYKKIVICLLLGIVAYIVAINLYDLYTMLYTMSDVDAGPSLTINGQPMVSMSVTAFGISAAIENSDTWITVVKVMTTVLGTYLGIKLINKYFKK